jgi:hypothetical protein
LQQKPRASKLKTEKVRNRQGQRTEANRQIDKEKDRDREQRQTDRKTNRNTNRKTETENRDRQTDRQTDRKTDRRSNCKKGDFVQNKVPLDFEVLDSDVTPLQRFGTLHNDP